MSEQTKKSLVMQGFRAVVVARNSDYCKPYVNVKQATRDAREAAHFADMRVRFEFATDEMPLLVLVIW